MIDISARFEHYRRRFREAMDDRALTNEALAEKVGAHSVTISKLRSGKLDLDDEWRARIAAAFNIQEEVLFGSSPLPKPMPHEMFVPKKRGRKKAANDNVLLPVYGLAAGSMQGAHSMTSDPIEEVPCPASLRDVQGAYALLTRGDSMVPRYFPNDRLYVNPHQPVRAKVDHVIIQTRLHDNSGTETWVKRFDGEDGDEIVAWQYNPPAQIRFKKKYVNYVHRVLPWNELV